MKNSLTDLNNHLFAQLERLGDEELDEAAIAKEVVRATAIVSVADKIIQNAATQVKAMQVIAEHGGAISIPGTLAITFKEQ